MQLSEDVYEDELIDAFDAAEPEAPASSKSPITSPQVKSANFKQPTRLNVQEVHTKIENSPTLYPTFDDTLEAPVVAVMLPSNVSQPKKMRQEVQRQDAPLTRAQVVRDEELMSDEDLQTRRRQIEHDMREYQERFDHVAQALAGKTPHQVQERKKRDEKRLERQEKRYEAMETRLQHQIERLDEREERRARIQTRHHRASRSPSPSNSREEGGEPEGES